MPFSKSILFLLVFAFLFLPSMSFAAQWDDFIYTESGDSITITDYAGSGTAVVIPNTIGGKTVTAIGFVAFFNCTDLTSLTLPGSITRIEPQAFSGCTGLTSLTIPDSVTSIGAEAFSYCTGLTSLTIPDSVTSIGPEAFSNCTHLTAIEVDADNPAYSSLDGVLYNKAGTVLIQYPGGRSGEFAIPGSVTSIGGYAFFACSGLTGISIQGSVKSVGDYAFFGCTGLTAAYFYGNAPVTGSEVFKSCADGFTVYYTAGSTGFTNPWCGYPTATFCPAPELIAPDGAGIVPKPAFSWQQIGSAAWYNVLVWSEATGSIVASMWVGPVSCKTGTCSANSSNTLPAGKNWWWLNVWYGDKICGLIEQPGGKRKLFEVAACTAPSLTSPDNVTIAPGTKPTFIFSDTGAEWYNILVWTSAGFLALDQWEDAAVKCASGTCTVLSNNSFGAGTTNWWWLNTYSASCGFIMQPGGHVNSFTMQ